MINTRDSLAIADAVLAAPPARPFIERYAGRGRRVLRVILPLGLTGTTNRTRNVQAWQAAKTKEGLFTAIQVQAARQGLVPGLVKTLDGRPQVLCVRFSSVRPDAYGDFAKSAVDLLCVPKKRKGKLGKGLSLIRGDKPTEADVRQWWEPSPPGEGFVLIEVWTGGEA